MKTKFLSSVAKDLVQRCAQELESSSVDELIEEMEQGWKDKEEEDGKLHGEEEYGGGNGQKLVEYCSAKTLLKWCSFCLQDKISDGSFTRFTYDMMLSWQMPTSSHQDSFIESAGKGKEDKKVLPESIQEQQDIPLFYSDIMPLLVDNEQSVGEDAFVWLTTLIPLAADVVNARFVFEMLTATTANRLHFPAYDMFIKQIHKCVQRLQKHAPPSGVVLADDEFILHVDGTATSQRVVRHIGGTSWPGRMTLTNYALYFEASGIVSYEEALKINLSKDTEQDVRPDATGPWGSPLFDKAIQYQSSEMPDGAIFEFPELTSSTRRDHWLALVKEIISMHNFLRKYNVESPVVAWEIHARTILGIIRLHAAREMLRISPPVPRSFLIVSLCDELPKGDYVLEELSSSLKDIKTGHPCSASSLLRSLNASQPSVSCLDPTQISDPSDIVQTGDVSSLESAINQVREEAGETNIANAAAERLREEGISESAQILMGLVKPVLEGLFQRFQEISRWERPAVTISFIIAILVVTSKEWVGPSIAALLLWTVAIMLCARWWRTESKDEKIVICTASDSSTVESIVSAQQGLRTMHEMMQMTNIAILKIWSLLTWRSYKHSIHVVIGMTGAAILLAVIPIKLLIIVVTLNYFISTSKLGRLLQNDQSNRRLKEWWESIPVQQVETVDKLPDS